MKMPSAPVAVLIAITSCQSIGAHAQEMDARKPSAKLVPGFNSVDIGGRTLRYMCKGSGSPTVIVEQALGNSIETVFGWPKQFGWAYIAPRVGKVTSVCVYDRAGLGHSAPLSKPRTSIDTAHDLRALLDKAGLAPPYVLAGHSFGGINARAFASEYPDTVAGMVLVESSSPDQSQQFEKALPPRSPDESAILKGFRDGPERSMQNGEWYDFSANAELARTLKPLGSIPLIVLTRTPKHIDPGPVPKELQLAIDPIAQEMQRELVKLSTNGKQIIAKNAGHLIPAEDPELVIDAILDVVKQARK